MWVFIFMSWHAENSVHSENYKQFSKNDTMTWDFIYLFIYWWILLFGEVSFCSFVVRRQIKIYCKSLFGPVMKKIMTSLLLEKRRYSILFNSNSVFLEHWFIEHDLARAWNVFFALPHDIKKPVKLGRRVLPKQYHIYFSSLSLERALHVNVKWSKCNNNLDLIWTADIDRKYSILLWKVSVYFHVSDNIMSRRVCMTISRSRVIDPVVGQAKSLGH